MSIGISLNVDAQQVKSAKREVDFLNKALKETEKQEVAPGGKEGTKDYSEIVKKLAEDIRRLKSISTAGDRQGGLLNKNQFAEVEKLAARIGKNFGSYSLDLARSREELGKLLRERENLEKVGRGGKYESLDAFRLRKERLGTLKDEIGRRESEVASLGKHEGRVGMLRGQAKETGEAIAGFGTMPGQGLPIKKALGIGAALMGGMSLLGFLNDSMAKAVAFGAGNADLTRRGGQVGNRSSYGFSPLESLQIADTLNRTTGFRGAGLDRSSELIKMFSRGQGLSEDSVAGYAGGIYQATGLTAPLFEKHMERLRAAFVKGGVGGRAEEFLNLNQRILSRIAQGTGGELASRELQWVTALQSGLWSMPGMTGKGEMGADLISRLDQGIRSGGKSPGEQLFLFRALGGGNIRSVDDYYDYTRSKEKGISDPKALRSVYDLAQGEFGTDEKGGLSTTARLSLMSMFGLTTRQADMLSDMGAKGMFDEQSMRKFAEASGSLKGDAEGAMGLPGNVHRQIVADVEELKLLIGEGVLPAVDLLKGGLTSASKALLKFAGELGLEESPLYKASPEDMQKQMRRDDPRWQEQYGYADSNWYKWMRNASRRTVRSMGVVGDEAEDATGGEGNVEALADRIGQKLAEAMERQAGRVQRVEVVNPAATPATPMRATGSGR